MGDEAFNKYMQNCQGYLKRAYYYDDFINLDAQKGRLKEKFPFLDTEQLPTIIVEGTEATMDLGRPKGCVWENWIQDKIMFANDRAKLATKIQEWETKNQNTQDAIRTLFQNIKDEMGEDAPETLPSVRKLTEEIRCRSALATRLTLIAIGDDVT